MADATETFSDYVRQFEEAEQASQGGRREGEKARDYFDGRQFTAEEEKTLRKRKQPITPENLIKEKVETLCGLERQGRTDPKAYPRVPSKEDDANAATDALRYVKEDQDLDIKKSKVFEDMLVEGFGGVEVAVRQLGNGIIDPYVVRIAWNRLYADPHSSEADYSDASYTGYVTWMDAAAAKLKWRDKADIIDATMQRGTSARFDTYDDKPRWSFWSDPARNRIRINTHYHLVNGVWHKCVFTLAGELEDSSPSPFIDDEGKPENPLILQSAYVDRDNDRYGIVRDMIPLQDEVNKRRSKFLHIVNSNRWRITPALQQDKELLRKELARPDGIVLGDAGAVENLDTIAKESGQFTLLQDTRASLKGNIGPNAYLGGKAGESQSGRAVLAQQQAGMTQMTPLLDNLRHFDLRVFRQIWNRIRQYWTAERWVRVTDDEKNVRFVGFNTPPKMTAVQAMQAHAMVAAAQQSGQLDPQTAAQYHARVDSMAKIGNAVGELDVDIDIEEVNETPTLQIEQFEQLVQLASSGMLGQPVPPDVVEMIVQASQLRDKNKLIEIVERMKEQASQNPMQQMQVEGAAAELESKQADAAKSGAEAGRAQQQTRKAAAEAEKAELEVQALAGQLQMVGPMLTGDKVSVSL